jgi:hypothetical protein
MRPIARLLTPLLSCELDTEGLERPMATRNETHDGAVRRLRAAIAEQDRLTYAYEAAVGTSAEPTADAARRGADERVMARDAWLKWVDEDDYRGLDAGRFSIRRELDD